MSEFQTAVDLVETTLRELRDQGVELRASAEALERLAATPSEASTGRDAAPSASSGGTKVAGLADRAAEGPVSNVAASIESVAEKHRLRQPQDLDQAKRAEAATSLEAPKEPRTLVERIAPLEGTKAERLAAMRGPVLACTKCQHLVQSRTQVVFGVGNPEAELMFVGEAPGADEDLQGEPFVGLAGQLLTKIVEAMGFRREDVYIANVLKCRPDMPRGMSGNRPPKPEEMQVCLPYLREQIDIIQPKVIVALGATAVAGLIGSTERMGQLRGRWHDFDGTPLMVTYHPAYLLRNQSVTEKRKVWDDMLLVLERLGKTITEKQRNFFRGK
jgi:DNA polymerase